MDSIEEILHKFTLGKLSFEEVVMAVEKERSESILKIKDFAQLDMTRVDRTGIPEVILAGVKSCEAVAEIAIAHATAKGFAVISRAKKEDVAELKRRIRSCSRRKSTEAIKEQYTDLDFELDYNHLAKTVVIKQRGYTFERLGKIGIIAAGTADISVAEEARTIAEVCGCEVITAYDVGVAGIHRLAEPLLRLKNEKIAAVIVAAGMDAVLPIVVAGLMDVPVIGLPTSVGYGMGGNGTAAILTMLQSCAPGLAVVNIDNGVGAGSFAAKCVRLLQK